MDKLSKVAVIGCALLFAVASLNAQAKTEKKESTGEKTYKGYLADKMCGTGFVKSGDEKKAAEKAKKHTKECALEENCKASGYGLVIGAKFQKFNDAGDKLAVEYLNKTKRENNLIVQVKGTMDGDVLNVTSVKDAK